MLSDIGDATRAAVVNAKVKAVSVEGGGDANTIMGWRSSSGCCRGGNQGAQAEQRIDEEGFPEFDTGALQRNGSVVVLEPEGKQPTPAQSPAILEGRQSAAQPEMQESQVLCSSGLEDGNGGVGPGFQELAELVR